jgi:sensor domain CHASE-containing protein
MEAMIFSTENEDTMLLGNIPVHLQDYVVSQPRIPQSEQSQPWKLAVVFFRFSSERRIDTLTQGLATSFDILYSPSFTIILAFDAP